MDVSAGVDTCFRVGFVRDIPYLSATPVWDQLSIVPVGATNGTLFFLVVNPLQSQNSAASVTVTVFARGGSNMDFGLLNSGVYCMTNGDPTSSHGPYPIEAAYSLQGKGATGNDGSVEPDFIELVPSSGAYPTDDIHFGERISSVRALMQKPFRLLTPPVVPTSVPTILPLGGLLPNGVGGTPIGVLSFAGWYRSMFSSFAASERYKVITKSATHHFGIGPASTTLSAYNWVNQMTPVSWIAENQGYEVLIPYYCQQKALPGNSVMSFTGGRCNVYQVLNATGNYDSTVAVTPAVYYSFGPDIRLGMFRFTPVVDIAPVTPAAATTVL